jgi:hypothetical protein
VTRTSTIVTLAILSSILTPVVVKATGMSPETSAAVQPAKIEAPAVTTLAAAPATPACNRSVKVVYGAFSEVHAAACAVTAEIRR